MSTDRVWENKSKQQTECKQNLKDENKINNYQSWKKKPLSNKLLEITGETEYRGLEMHISNGSNGCGRKRGNFLSTGIGSAIPPGMNLGILPIK